MKVRALLDKVNHWYRDRQYQWYGFTGYVEQRPKPAPPPDPRFDPIDVIDQIDALVNESLRKHP